MARKAPGHYYVVLTETGKPLRSRSLWDATLAVEPVAPGAERAYRAEGPSDQRLLVLSAGFRKGGERFTIAVAEDLSPLYQSLSRFNWVFAGLTLGILLKERGYHPLVIEREPEIRTEGYMMDFFGTGWDVAGRMGLVEALRAIRYPIDALEFVVEEGVRG